MKDYVHYGEGVESLREFERGVPEGTERMMEGGSERQKERGSQQCGQLHPG